MPEQTSLPSYRRHKARNCAVVTIRGRNFYLGKYDSPESKEEYARLIAENFGKGRFRRTFAKGRRTGTLRAVECRREPA